MRRYKRFLQGLLTVNLFFVIAVSGLGLKMKLSENEDSVEKTFSSQVYSASATEEKQVIPVGQTVGIYINTEGILVIDTSGVTDINGNIVYPAKSKLVSGDYIMKVNGETVRTKKQLVERITKCKGESLTFDVKRNGAVTKVKIHPVKTGVDEYKIGIWVRDNLQGLGTVTYVDDNDFAALGHSITDCDTGVLLDVSNGSIYNAEIFGVEKGVAGAPGEIEGMISYQTENVMGTIKENEIYGIYGSVTDVFSQKIDNATPVSIISAKEVERGTAYIQSYVSGAKELYEAEIVGFHKNEYGDIEMEIKITDKRLIALTGGVIQGMSGSPILQDGKLVGAVTHVFVDDPTRGYAIFIENMLR